MKTKFILFSIICLVTNFTSLAQAPEGILYHSDICDASENLFTNSPIDLQFNLCNFNAVSKFVLNETQSVLTNALVLFSVNLREVTVNNESLALVDKFSEVTMNALGKANNMSPIRSEIKSINPHFLKSIALFLLI